MLTERLRIPFRLRGEAGAVSVSYGVNTDPEYWGFGLFDVPFDLALIHGFPVVHATIDFPAPGYRALMGWIQVVTVEEWSPVETWASVDVYPIHWQADTPFAEFGYLPEFFDAPGPNPPRANERWTAETFLAVCAGGARRRVVAPVLGFCWGYELTEMRATPFAPFPASEHDWQRCLATLRESYPAWEFGASFIVERR